jgi:3-mercaptopyruvate sulfurtransferase SseA
MTMSISTQALAGAREDPACVVVDVREMAAFNGWRFHHEARGGHLRGAVALPLEWTALVQGTAFQRLLVSKGITPHRTVVVYDVLRDRSAAMASRLRTLGYSSVVRC